MFHGRLKLLPSFCCPATADLTQLGQLLRAARKQRGLTQAEVGARLGWAGKEFQHPPAARRTVPADAALRRHVGLPRHGRGPNQWSPRKLKLAMALVGKNRHYEAERIQRRHFNSTAKRFGYGETAEPLIGELIERTPTVIDEVQRTLPPGFSDEVAGKVLSGLRTSVRVFEVMPAD